MQLELRFPRARTHPVTQFLREWCTRLGYRVRHGDDYPALLTKWSSAWSRRPAPPKGTASSAYADDVLSDRRA